jgi:hypothetical protein
MSGNNLRRGQGDDQDHLTLVHVFVTPHVIKSLIKSLKLQLSLKARGNQVVEV